MRALKLLTTLLVAFAGPQFFTECLAEEHPWPPELPGATSGTVSLKSKRFLKVHDSVVAAREKEGAANFVMAKKAPTVDLAFHRELGPEAISRRLWSSWGDICVAHDGRVYCGIGDHGNDVGGDARCFIYCWDPKAKTLTQVVDVNAIAPREPGQPAWSKIHAKIDEGPNGTILFCGTLNDGNRAKLPTYKWSDALPGAQVYQVRPEDR